MRSDGFTYLRSVRGLLTAGLRNLRQLLRPPPRPPCDRGPPRLADLLPLEERRLPSAVPIGPDFDPNTHPTGTLQPAPIFSAGGPAASVPGTATGTGQAQAAPQELVIIDPHVSGYQQLLSGLPGPAEGRSLQVVVLDGNRDGVEQISALLAEYHDLDAVHIVSHGAAGEVQLGSTFLDAGDLSRYAGAIQGWGQALSPGADLLFYGCDVAATAEGQGLLRGVSALTGADVAGSTDLTGNAARGGNWDLEYQTSGPVRAAVPFAGAALSQWQGVLATLTVTNTNDSGAGSLRQAILDANGMGGLDTIDFAIGSGVQTIKPTSALPAITNHVIIDATTQPGYSGKPIIVLDGSLAGSGTTGLLITAGNSTVRGLVIDNFDGTGLELNGGGGNLIEGNYIGTDVTGTIARGNGAASWWDPGLLINSSANNTIGTTAAARNLLSGNVWDGLDIDGSASTGNLVQGNYLGTDVSGKLALADYNGIWIGFGAGNNTLGGTTAGAGNLVSGNADDGIEIDGSSGDQSSGNRIEGNFIGTDVTGTAPLGNADCGVSFEDALNNQIGGTAAGAGNVISGNQSSGIVIDGSASTGDVVQGNFIGTDLTGALSLGNNGSGITISDTGDGSTLGFPGNLTIGGTGAGAGNTIAHNVGDGVVIVGGSGDTVQGNIILANTGLGIDLGGGGSVAANTGTKNSALPNHGMNFPVFTSQTVGGGTLTVAGYIGTAPGQGTFGGSRVEIYKSDNDPSGHGQGQTYLGFLTANGSGNFSGLLTVSGLNPGDTITATATDGAGNTSEFAANATVGNSPGGLIGTSTTVVSSRSPAQYGQAVTFTATVSALGILPSLTGTVTFMDGGTNLGTASLLLGSAAITTSTLSAGSHSITAFYSGDGLFAASASSPLSQTVTPAPLTVTASNASKVYGQANPAFSVSYVGFVNGDDASALGGTLSFGTPATTGSPVGNYAVTPSGLTSSDYSITFANGTLSVTRATLTVTANDTSKAYSQANPAFSDTLSGFVNGDAVAVVSGAATLTTAATGSSGVGSYTITAAQDSLSAGNYAFAFANGTLTITPAALTVTANDTSKVYGQANPSFGDTITGYVNGDIAAVVSGSATLTTAATASSGVGSYTITAAQGSLSASNYTFAFANGTLSVTPATLTVTANDAGKVYGQANPVFSDTITGFVNGDAVAVVSGSASLTTAATAGSGVGAYAITAAQGSLSATNYTFAFRSGSLTITPAPLTVTANNASKVYGQANPAFSVSYLGFVNGDNASALGGTLSFGTPATTGSPVGNYAVTPSGLTSSDYTITFANGTLSVTPATLTVTANDTSKAYGQANPAFSDTITGFVNGDLTAVVSGAATLTTAATAGSGVVGYAITAAQGSLSASNYAFAFANGTLTVTPATLTVTANDARRPAGQPDPIFTASYSGFVNGDSSASLSGALTFSTPATAASAAGSYGVTPGGLTAANYTLAFVNGTLTVTANPAGFTVTPTFIKTSTAGTSASFSVALSSAPLAPVTIHLSPTETGHGTLSQIFLTFDAGDWNVAQTITVTGQGDHKTQGDHQYQILGTAASNDGNYDGLTMTPVTVLNKDAHGAGGDDTSTSPPVTTGAGGTSTLTVPLTGAPVGGTAGGLASGPAGSVAHQPLSATVPGQITTALQQTVSDVPPVFGLFAGTTGQASSAVRSADLTTVVTAQGTVFAGLATTGTTGWAAGLASGSVSTFAVGLTDLGDGSAYAIIAVQAHNVAVPSPNSPFSNFLAPLPQAGPFFAPAAAYTVSTAAAQDDLQPSRPRLAYDLAFDVRQETLSNARSERAAAFSSWRGVDIGLTVADSSVIVSEGEEGEATAAGAGRGRHGAASFPRAAAHGMSGQPDASDSDVGGGPVAMMGLTATAGYVLLNTRAGSWLLGVLASRPLWRQFDPLEVLFAWEEEQGHGDDEEETLLALVE